jgi:starch synthase
VRIAFLSFDFGEYCIRLASALTPEVDVMLLLPEAEAAPHHGKLEPAVQLRTFDKPRLRQPLQQIRMIAQILGDLRRFEPDLVHVQQGHLWFNAALPLLRKYPLVLTVHDPRPHAGDRGGQKTPGWVLDFGFRRAVRLIAHGKQIKQVVVDECHIPADKIDVIPHVAIGDESGSKGTPEDESLVLFFGRIWPYKGLDYLIRAEPLITAQVPDARIVIAGEGEAFDRYRRMMVHPERFIVHNEYVSETKQAELFRRASLVVLPYVEATQTGVIPVAYTFGKPVVATAVGGLPDMVEDGRTGYLVPPRDEEALAEAIVRLLRDKEQRRQMGANGKRKIDTECSPSTVAQQTLAVYQRALNGIHSSVENERQWTNTYPQR